MTGSQTMRGMVMTGHGGPEMLNWREDLPRPVAGPGDVLIRVAAAGVNNTDINTRVGWYARQDPAQASWSDTPLSFPRVQGADVCGHIVSVGEGVLDSRIGERVLIEPCFQEFNGQPLATPWYLGSECDGGFAQYTRVPARYAHKITCDLSDVELASFPCSYSTAENLLTRAQVGQGDKVLVTGASGGVGSAAVQLAQARGAQVVAVTSPQKAAALAELGASRTLNRDADLVAQLGQSSMDVVIDLVGGEIFPTLLDVLSLGGRYAVSGAVGGAHVSLDLRTLYLKDLRFFGCTVLEPEVFGQLVDRIEKAQIKPLVAETYPLKDMALAQQSFAQKSYIGKIVLKVE